MKSASSNISSSGGGSFNDNFPTSAPSLIHQHPPNFTEERLSAAGGEGELASIHQQDVAHDNHELFLPADVNVKGSIKKTFTGSRGSLGRRDAPSSSGQPLLLPLIQVPTMNSYLTTSGGGGNSPSNATVASYENLSMNGGGSPGHDVYENYLDPNSPEVRLSRSRNWLPSLLRRNYKALKMLVGLRNEDEQSNSNRNLEQNLNGGDTIQFVKKPAASVYVATSSLVEIRALFRVVRSRARQDKNHHNNNYTHQNMAYLLIKQAMIVFSHQKARGKKYIKKYNWVLMLASLFVEIALCVTYLHEAQYNLSSPCPKASCDTGLPQWLIVNRTVASFSLLQTFAVIKVVLLFMKKAQADSSYAYWLNGLTLLDIVTVVPFLVLPYFQPTGLYIYIPYFLQIFLLTKNVKATLNGLRIQKSSIFNIKYTTEKLIMLIVNIFNIIYVGMCTFNYSETNFPGERRSTSSQLNLMDSFYFIVITISTVGYGDIVPTSVPGQFVVLLLIIAAITILPSLVSEFQKAIQQADEGGGMYSPGRNPFIVLYSPNLQDSDRIIDCIKNIFAKDNASGGTSSTTVVLMSKAQLSSNSSLKYQLKTTKFKNRVFFINGNGLDASCFERIASLEKAKGIFILANLNAENKRIEDENNTLRAWSFNENASKVPIYVETLRVETSSLQEGFTAGSVCIDDFQQIFLAYNCIYRGVGTLMLNLIKGAKKYSEYSSNWHMQYGDGVRSEIFKTNIINEFIGKSFLDLSIYLFKEFQVILFGLHIYIPEYDRFHVAINPSHYIIKPKDFLFVICNSYEDIKLISSLSKNEFDNSFTVMESTTKPAPLDQTKSFNGQPLDQPKPSDHYHCGYPEGSQGLQIPLCLLLDAPSHLHNAVIPSTDHLENFILVLSTNYDIFRFVATLRGANLTSNEFKTIVIMSHALPSQEEFLKLSYFPLIYICRGDMRQQSSLKKAGVLRADKIVIMDLSSNHGSSSNQEEELLDSANILVSNLIFKMCSEAGVKKHVITNLRKQGNINFLASSRRQKGRRWTANGNAGTQKDVLYTPAFASGRVLVTMMLEALLSSAIAQPYQLEIFRLICGVRYEIDDRMDGRNNLRPSSLCYISMLNLWEEVGGKNFGDLFKFASSTYQIIPIGLLRERGIREGSFVYTNPVHSLLLRPTDLIYCLAHPDQLF